VPLRDALAAKAGVSVDQRVVIPPWQTRISRWALTPYGSGITLADLGAIVAARVAHSWSWLGLLVPILIVNVLLVPSFYSLDAEQRAARNVWVLGAIATAALILGVVAVGGPWSGVLAAGAVAVTAVAQEHMYNRAREAKADPS